MPYFLLFLPQDHTSMETCESGPSASEGDGQEQQHCDLWQECPLCGDMFPDYAIELHASSCGDNPTGGSSNNPQTTIVLDWLMGVWLNLISNFTAFSMLQIKGWKCNGKNKNCNKLIYSQYLVTWYKKSLLETVCIQNVQENNSVHLWFVRIFLC